MIYEFSLNKDLTHHYPLSKNGMLGINAIYVETDNTEVVLRTQNNEY